MEILGGLVGLLAWLVVAPVLFPDRTEELWLWIKMMLRSIGSTLRRLNNTFPGHKPNPIRDHITHHLLPVESSGEVVAALCRTCSDEQLPPEAWSARCNLELGLEEAEKQYQSARPKHHGRVIEQAPYVHADRSS